MPGGSKDTTVTRPQALAGHMVYLLPNPVHHCNVLMLVEYLYERPTLNSKTFFHSWQSVIMFWYLPRSTIAEEWFVPALAVAQLVLACAWWLKLLQLPLLN